MTYRACIQIPLDVDKIYASIDNKMLKTPPDILVHLASLNIWIKPNIDTIKESRGEVF